jgi:hypothetical protein
MKIKIVDASSGIVTSRKMNVFEVDEYEQHQEKAAQDLLTQAAKVKVRETAEVKLLELGLTTEDLKALLG